MSKSVVYISIYVVCCQYLVYAAPPDRNTALKCLVFYAFLVMKAIISKPCSVCTIRYLFMLSYSQEIICGVIWIGFKTEKIQLQVCNISPMVYRLGEGGPGWWY